MKTKADEIFEYEKNEVLNIAHQHGIVEEEIETFAKVIISRIDEFVPGDSKVKLAVIDIIKNECELRSYDGLY